MHFNPPFLIAYCHLVGLSRVRGFPQKFSFPVTSVGSCRKLFNWKFSEKSLNTLFGEEMSHRVVIKSRMLWPNFLLVLTSKGKSSRQNVKDERYLWRTVVKEPENNSAPRLCTYSYVLHFVVLMHLISFRGLLWRRRSLHH